MMFRVVAISFILLFAGCLGTDDAPDESEDTMTMRGTLQVAGPLPCTTACPVELGTHDAFEPDLDVGPDGTVLVAHSPFMDGVRTLEVFVRTPAGTWQEPDLPDLLADSTLQFCTEILDPATLVLDDGTLVLVAIADGTSRVLFSIISEDQGTTWSDPQVIAPETPGGCLANRPGANPDFVRTVEHADGEPWIVWRAGGVGSTCTGCFGLATLAPDREWATRTISTDASDDTCRRQNSLPHAAFHDGTWSFVSSAWGTDGPTHYCRGESDGVSTELSPFTEAHWGWAVTTWTDPGWAIAGSIPKEDNFQTMLWHGNGSVQPIGEASTTPSATQILSHDGNPWVLWGESADATALYLSNGTHEWVVDSDTTIHGANVASIGHYIGFEVHEDTFWMAWTQGERPNRQLVVGGFPVPST